MATRVIKPYIWWMDDPWAALVTMAIIILVLCIILIVIVFITYSRYMKYINQYRVYQSSYDNPDFVEPPSFLREYETQSLNMYVPPDEAMQSYGEVGMRLQGDTVLDVQHTSHISGVAAAVNPLYQNEQHHTSTTGRRSTHSTIERHSTAGHSTVHSTSFAESTTML